MDERAFGLWGLPDEVSFEELSAHDRARAAFLATRSVVGDYEIDFRIIGRFAGQ